jgi:predicted deacetylase
MTSRLAVCLHDVSPRTLRRCQDIRSWLARRGVDRATLLVIPCEAGTPLAPDGDAAAWLRGTAAAGDVVAQHGLHHRRSRACSAWRDWIADRQGGAAAEFVGLDAAETAFALAEGRHILMNAGLSAAGFVAPAYAYTPQLRRELRRRFDWYAGVLAIHARRETIHAPAHGLGTSTRLKRQTSALVLRAGARMPTSVRRVDVHPADFDLPRHVEALDRVLRPQSRRCVTYDQIAA